MVKSKNTAVVLAVLLSFWTWCYTYRTDAKRFWVGLVASIIGGLLHSLALGLLIWGAVWLAAVISSARRPRDFYSGYGSTGAPQ